MNSENGQFPGEGLPPMPGVTLPDQDASDRKEGLEIMEAPGPEGEIVPIGDLIPEEGLPIPEFRAEETSCTGAAPEEEPEEFEEDIEVEIIEEEDPDFFGENPGVENTVGEEEVCSAGEYGRNAAPEGEADGSEEDIEVEILSEEELSEPWTGEDEEDIRVEIVPEEELPDLF